MRSQQATASCCKLRQLQAPATASSAPTAPRRFFSSTRAPPGPGWHKTAVSHGRAKRSFNADTPNLAAPVDAAGMAFDAVLFAAPGIPGGAGLLIDAGRGADKAAEIIKGVAKRADAALSLGQGGKVTDAASAANRAGDAASSAITPPPSVPKLSDGPKGVPERGPFYVDSKGILGAIPCASSRTRLRSNGRACSLPCADFEKSSRKSRRVRSAARSERHSTSWSTAMAWPSRCRRRS